MRITFIVLLAVLTVALCAIRVYFNKKRKVAEEQKKEDYDGKITVLRSMRALLYTGILGLVIFSLIILYILLFQFEDWPGAIILSAIEVFYVCLLLYYINWRVEVKDEEFTYRNFFRVKKTYRYSDIEIKYISAAKTGYYVNGKKVFTMPYYVENEHKLERAYKKYKQRAKRKTD